MTAAMLAQVFAQQLAGQWDRASERARHSTALDASPDPARRRAIVGGFHFDAAIQVHRALAVLVIAEGFDGQRQQRRFLFCEHRRNLPFGSAMNARVGPALFPAIQVGLRFFEGFEALSF